MRFPFAIYIYQSCSHSYKLLESKDYILFLFLSLNMWSPCCRISPSWTNDSRVLSAHQLVRTHTDDFRWPILSPTSPSCSPPQGRTELEGQLLRKRGLRDQKDQPIFQKRKQSPRKCHPLHTIWLVSGILPFYWPLWLYRTGGSLLLYDKEVEASLMVTFLCFLEAVGSLASDMFPACVVRCLSDWPTPCWLGSWSQSPFEHWPEITGHRTSQDFSDLNPFPPHLSSSRPLRKQLQDSYNKVSSLHSSFQPYLVRVCSGSLASARHTPQLNNQLPGVGVTQPVVLPSPTSEEAHYAKRYKMNSLAGV